MPSKGTSSKKSTKTRKLELRDLDSKKDPKGGLNFEEVKRTYDQNRPPAGQDGTADLMNLITPPRK